MRETTPWPKIPILLPILGLVPTIYALMTPPAQGFRNPDLARILFFHLPCAFMVTGLSLALLWFGWQTTRQTDTRARLEWDARNGTMTELNLLFGALTLVTGILFSKAQWGDWWQSDPRQTSFLMVTLILIAAVTLRAAISDPERRAVASGAFSLYASVPLFFLIYIFPSLPQVKQGSMHPTGTTLSGGLTGPYWLGVLMMLGIELWLITIVYRQRLWIEFARISQAYDHEPSDSLRKPVTGVVQPRAVRPVDGAEKDGD